MNLTRESIFGGALRSFCTSFAAMIGILFGFFVIAIAVTMVSKPNFLPEKAQPMIMPDAQGQRALLPGNSPVVLRLNLHGVVGVGDFTAEKISNLLLDSQEDFLQGRVKAVLLHINSPGGLAIEGEAIYHALVDYKLKHSVPMYAYVEGICASGGMMIACAANKIYASESSMIGSVGVIMGPVFNFSEAMAKYGIESLTLTEGKDKDALNPFRPWKPNEAESIQHVMASTYDQFLTIVTRARPNLSREKLVNEYGANIFIAKEAQTFGYIDDGSSNYSQALTALVQAAGIKDKVEYQVVQLESPRPFFPDLTHSLFKTGTITHKLDLGPQFDPALAGQILYLYNPSLSL